jgi:hypothetical protein
VRVTDIGLKVSRKGIEARSLAVVASAATHEFSDLEAGMPEDNAGTVAIM